MESSINTHHLLDPSLTLEQPSINELIFVLSLLSCVTCLLSREGLLQLSPSNGLGKDAHATYKDMKNRSGTKELDKTTGTLPQRKQQ